MHENKIYSTSVTYSNKTCLQSNYTKIIKDIGKLNDKTKIKIKWNKRMTFQKRKKSCLIQVGSTADNSIVPLI